MNKLSAKHFVLFIFGVTCISYKTYTSIFIDLGGRDTWICLIAAFLLFLAFAMYLTHIIDSRNPCDINYIFTTGLSKPIGNVFIMLFALGLFLASLEAAAVEVNIMKTNFFTESPIWYIMLFFLLPSIFLLGKKIETLLIFIIVSIASLVFNSLLLSLIVEKYKNVEYLLPVLGPGLKPSLFYCILLIIGSFSAFVIVLPYIKYVTRNSKLKKHNFISLALIGIFMLYTTIGLISTFGPLRASNIFYPEYIQAQRVQIGGFISFGELFFLFQTIIGFFIKYLLCSYGIYIIYEKYIHNKKVFITVYTLLVFVLASFIGSNNYILFRLLNYYQVINLVLFVAVPLIAAIGFNIRAKKAK